MRTPPNLLRFIARAALNIAGGGVLGDFAVDVLPDMAKDVWKWWNRGQSEDQLRAELQTVAQLSVIETKGYAELAAQVEGAGQPETVRQAVANYVALVPSAIRQSQRRPADPSGLSLSSGFSLCCSEDLLHFLPGRIPRFRAGDQPLGIGDWQLEELLGMGGFGEVWKACNPHLPNSVVALKFCIDPKAAKVLRNEAALLGRVMSEGKHRGIVRLLHTYLNADPPCLEYEYVSGGDLSKVITKWHRSPSTFTVEKATKLIYNLAEIVGYAHHLNPPIVHRDLKPTNILLHQIDKKAYSLRIADFGIGGVVAEQALTAFHRSSSSRGSLVTTLRGAYTPLYASPQQVRGEPPDSRDDVHALGVIWYQLLTGDMNILSLPADWQDEVRSRGLSDDLLALLASCLASRLEKRPADAGELARQITQRSTSPIGQDDQASSADDELPDPAANERDSSLDSFVSGIADDTLPYRMANEWHYTVNGQPAAAPVSTAQLKQIAASGQLKPTDLVWQVGMVEWVPARSVRGLFPISKRIGNLDVVPPSSTTNPVDGRERAAPPREVVHKKGLNQPLAGWGIVVWCPFLLFSWLAYAALCCLLLPPSHPWRVRYPTLGSWVNYSPRWVSYVDDFVFCFECVFLVTVGYMHSLLIGVIIFGGLCVVDLALFLPDLFVAPSSERKRLILRGLARYAIGAAIGPILLIIVIVLFR